MNYNIKEDIGILKYVMETSSEDLAALLGISTRTFLRIESGEVIPSADILETIYNLSFRNGINLNKIKEMLYQEDHPKSLILFHGAKTIIDGPISYLRSKANNDFGAGFYCGEKYDQAASFVSLYTEPSIYVIQFDDNELKKESFDVTQEWMLAIAYYRGAIKQYKNHPSVKKIISKIERADYVYAPIADNRMYKIIDQFLDGYITDEQCKHCLAATNLGKQYVFKTDKAVKSLNILERCYISLPERRRYQDIRKSEVVDGENKVRAALIKYKNKGKYIEEILKW